jgi:hypothetical protein
MDIKLACSAMQIYQEWLDNTLLEVIEESSYVAFNFVT